MKKLKQIKEYFFKDLDHNDMISIINRDLPLTIKYNEDLVNRISAKYPILNKTEISIIVTAVFQSIRDLLVLGKILNFNSLFFDTKFLVFSHKRNNIVYPSIKVKISTPPPLR